ncbi:MAG: DinB family protein [Terriglobales bacterium]
MGDILMHVALHSGYHRGQIAADMRSGGLEPAYTDYIHWRRQVLDHV